ncbi:MAG: polysaccharide deacetylase family protein [Kofleriaceae bacterium]
MRPVWFSAASALGLLCSIARAESVAPPAQAVASAELPAGPKTAGRAAADRVRGELGADLVAFTFDDGPDPHTTPMVLDALARYEIPATFFVVNRHLQGRRGEAGREVLRRTLAEGHMIGGHTANHARLRTANAEVLRLEIDESVTFLEATAGVRVSLFRPPYGVLGPTAAERLRELGLTDIRWSIDPQDFDNKDADWLRHKVLSDITRERGGVVLLHDTKRVTAGVIDKIFADLERENCRRMTRGRPAIIPVSLHYFLRDDGVPRPIPPEVEARTAAYRQALEDRCEARGHANAALADGAPVGDRDHARSSRRRPRAERRRAAAEDAPAPEDGAGERTRAKRRRHRRPHDEPAALPAVVAPSGTAPW